METRECYVIKENDLLGTNSDWVSVLYMRRKFKKKKGLKGLTAAATTQEKKCEEELLQNIFHQLGMLSWAFL